MAEELVPSVMKVAGIEDYETVGHFKGADCEYMKTRHPLYDRVSLVIVGDHVTLDSGTGCVHTAPGFGADDFTVCQKYPEISADRPGRRRRPPDRRDRPVRRDEDGRVQTARFSRT